MAKIGLNTHMVLIRVFAEINISASHANGSMISYESIGPI